MLKLKNVSKFYYGNGTVSSGISKVNLEFKIGEFIVITGESGSGKSTLLNVISGLDTYEEGEMYVNGLETSHYRVNETEEYRKKYIGNIFQNFNLINSYTVYQNIEISLLLNGMCKKEMHDKIISLLKEVDLYKFRNTRASKLSGGQKQRVAIARCLAKNSPIIVADEPTGSLDRRSATSIMSLLKEISKDKLVIVVTHNEEDVIKYASRKIKMSDGKVIEDKVLHDVDEVDSSFVPIIKSISFINMLKLSFRNTFNIFSKFSLLLIVYLFLTVTVFSEYSSVRKQKSEMAVQGFNQFFKSMDNKRIIITKKDKSFISDDELSKVGKISNVSSVIKDDILIDAPASISNGIIYLNSTIKSIDKIKGSLDEGVLPTKDNEVVLKISKNNYYFKSTEGGLLNKELDLNVGSYNLNGGKVKIVGIIYDNGEIESYESIVYTTNNTTKNISNDVFLSKGKFVSTFYDKKYSSMYYDTLNKIVPSSNVGVGKVIISNSFISYCKNENCINSDFKVDFESIFETNSIKLKVSNVYNKNNFNKLLSLKYEDNNGKIFISNEDYKVLTSSNTYQSSVILNNEESAKEVISELNTSGFNTLYVKDTLVNNDALLLKFFNVFIFIVTFILLVVLFFISYFVIKLILNSRSIYFSTIRVLGASKKNCKNLLSLELFNIMNLSYILFIGFLLLAKYGVINNGFLLGIIKYITIKDYIVLYLILGFMSYFISLRFSKKLFKDSAMSSYRSEL
ncbi:MAG: ABC transporter ATP-binding protein [Bacilli bacterium]